MQAREHKVFRLHVNYGVRIYRQSTFGGMDSEPLEFPYVERVDEVWNIIAPNELIARAYAENYSKVLYEDFRVVRVETLEIRAVIELHPY